MNLERSLAWAAERTLGVMITLRRDGRAQSSDVAYMVEDGRIAVSVTEGRAKTANMRRDPRVVIHVSDPAAWSYVSFDGIVELTPVTERPFDATAEALVRYYQAISGEHDDWDDYRRAMIADRRLLAWVTPATAVGQIHG